MYNILRLINYILCSHRSYDVRWIPSLECKQQPECKLSKISTRAKFDFWDYPQDIVDGNLQRTTWKKMMFWNILISAAHHFINGYQEYKIIPWQKNCPYIIFLEQRISLLYSYEYCVYIKKNDTNNKIRIRY